MILYRRKFEVSATVLLVLGALLLTGCRSTSPTHTSSPTTSASVTAPSPSLAELPVGEPVDLIRRASPPYVWNAVLANRIVAYAESDSYGFLQPGQAQQPTQEAIIKTLDLDTGQVNTVPGGGLLSPRSFHIWPWWFLTGLLTAETEDTGPSLIWGLQTTQYSRDSIPRWEELTGWNSSAGTRALLRPDAMTRPAILTGDVLALPLTSIDYEGLHGARVGTTIGEKLLLYTDDLDDPIAVDPAAPMLPETALAGISPYVSWSGWLLGGPPEEDAAHFRGDLPGKPPRVFDLHTGELVDIVVEDAREPEYWWASVVAGNWVAWVSIDESDPMVGSLYLADLSTGEAERLLDGDVPEQIGLSEDWLIWTDPAGDLVGYHLPDLTPVRVPQVLASGEYDFDQNLQISGDLVLLMVVAPDPNADGIGPSVAPMWTAIRVVRLR